jgi:hypothetical protein
VKRCTLEKFRKMFKTVEDFKEFCVVHFVDKDQDRAEELWNANVQKLIAYLVPLYGEGASPLKWWKVDDPGAQGFGQNFPRPLNPKMYYGGPDYYQRIEAGLPDFTYWVLKQLRERYRIPRDVFRMICDLSLQAEAEVSLDKLALF